MKSRPKLVLERSPFDNAMELVAKLLLLFLWVLAGYSLFTLPESIPVHYNLTGKPDQYGSKASIFILPAIGTVLYFGLGWLSKYPHIFNYVTQITEKNARVQYTIATRTIRVLKVTILSLFSVIIFVTILTAVGVINGLGVWFIPLVLILLLIPTIVFVWMSFKNR